VLSTAAEGSSAIAGWWLVEICEVAKIEGEKRQKIMQPLVFQGRQKKVMQSKVGTQLPAWMRQHMLARPDYFAIHIHAYIYIDAIAII
jgi:hypothetical protein